MIDILLPDNHVWLRLTKLHYGDPFNTSYARRHGGRWNPPTSWPTLYLNENMTTVHAQLRHLFLGRGIEPDDLDDHAPVLLAAATLPRRQHVADIVSADGIASAGLPVTYPVDDDGEEVGHDITRPVGEHVHAMGLRGVWCRSATQIGRELAWFPAMRSVARPAWPQPQSYRSWRHATTLEEVHVSPTPTRP